MKQIETKGQVMKKENEIKMPLEKYIEKVWKLFQTILKNMELLGETYVTAIDTYPEAKEKIKILFEEEAQPVSSHFWNRLEDIGRHRMHWRLMPGLSSGGNTAKIRRLPFSEQREIFDNNKRYPLLLEGGDHILVDLKAAEQSQVDQLIAEDYIRDFSEQKIWLAENLVKDNKAKEIIDPYRITSRGLEISGYIFTKTKLREILLRM